MTLSGSGLKSRGWTAYLGGDAMASGKERKLRRRVKRAENEGLLTEAVGDGATPPAVPVEESPMRPVAEARLVGRAVGWIGGGRMGSRSMRWPTRVPIGQLTTQIAERQDMTVMEKAFLTLTRLLDGPDRAKGIAARAIIAMERQNQMDDIAADMAGRFAGRVAAEVPVGVDVPRKVVRIFLPHNGREPVAELDERPKG